MMNQFHFTYPFWLLGLLPLVALLWWLFQHKAGSGKQVWDKVIDANLLPLLLKGGQHRSNKSIFYLLGIAWLISIIALADPVWKKIPRPVFQTNAARVLVLDLSSSMLANDLKPSRLARARFKIEDILSRKEEGQIGLVVFAGDAFTASPLTRDADTIRSLLKVLTPRIMPSQGSRADLGLAKAKDLLQQANIHKGEVLLIADGVVGDLAEQQAEELNQAGYRVSVLGVGTKAGGKIPNFRVVNGVPVIVKLEEEKLKNIAEAGDGSYQTIQNGNADLRKLLNPLNNNSIGSNNSNANKQDTENTNKSDDLTPQDWESTGPYLILLLLPLAAFAFRKGWLLSLFFLIGLSGMTLSPQPVYAFSFSDLWQRPDQQADKALHNQQFEQASQLAKDPLRRGSAEYKQGKFKQALESFSKATGIDADYNRGNTLAKLKQYPEAIKAYEKVLKKDPQNDDAKENKATVEKLLKEQQKKDKKKHDKKDQKKNDQNKKGKDGEKQSGNNNKSNKDQKDQQGKKGEQQKKQQGKDGEKQDQKDAQKGDAKKNQFSDAAKQLKDDKDAKNKKNQEDKADASNEKKPQQDQPDKNQKKGEAKAGDLKKQQKDRAKTQEKGTKAQADKLSKEEKMAAEQWLRRIPDDPGGLLRRKFQRQYRQHRRPAETGVNPW